MSLIDFLLNIAGLLLWLSWRGVYLPPAATATPGPLPRRSQPRAGWGHFLARSIYLFALLGLLLGRAFLYCTVGAPLHWEPRIRLNAISLLFYSDWPGRMVLFSFFSFGVALAFFYLCLLLLSSVNAAVPDAEPGQRLVRLHLGRLGRWPGWIKMLLPLFVITAVWCAVNPLLLWKINMVPPVSPWHLLAQGAVIGLAFYLSLKFLVVGFLALYVLNSYVYLGDSPFLNFVNTTSNSLLRPLRRLPLRLGRVDLAPLAGMALVLLVAIKCPEYLDYLRP